MASKTSLKRLLQRQKRFMDIETQHELEDTGDELKTHNEFVVRPWKHQPKFKAYRTLTSREKVVEIRPTGKHAKIWHYVDKGTKPHIIRAKNVPRLKFRTGYSARTAPVARANVGTGQSFGAWASPIQVNHPGTEAREFTETFFKELTPPFDERIQAAIQRGLDKANR